MDTELTRPFKIPRHLLERMLLNSTRFTFAFLPTEVMTQIVDYVSDEPRVRQPRSPLLTATAHPANTPPATGECLLMKVSSELRRAIFAESLPSRNAVHRPDCDDDGTKRSKNGNDQKFKDSFRGKPTGIVRLMLLNKKICAEIAEIVYEERTFVIHVHEGLKKGGIEFLNAGRQPLQYQDCVDDPRFWKFSTGDDFGFRRLKKIVIVVYPSNEKECKHNALNTYFMNIALCRMLERSGEKKNRIKSLTIVFALPKQAEDGYWFDPKAQAPRATSVHGISNLELVLRPFATLSGCLSADIVLPDDLSRHVSMCKFVADLESSMKSRHGTMFPDDQLERNIESARYAMEQYVLRTLYGTKHHNIPGLTEEEMQEQDQNQPDEGDLENDGEPGAETKGRKHSLSPYSMRNTASNDSKKKRATFKYSSSVEDEGVVMWAQRGERKPKKWEQDLERESEFLAQEHEDRLIQEAINESLGIKMPTVQEMDGDFRADDDDVITWLPSREGLEEHHAAYLSELRRMASRRKGCTLGSSASPQEEVGTSNNPILIDMYEDDASPKLHGSPSAQRGSSAWNTHLHNHGQWTATTTAKNDDNPPRIAQPRFVTLYQKDSRPSTPQAPATYTPTPLQVQSSSPTFSYSSSSSASYTTMQLDPPDTPVFHPPPPAPIFYPSLSNTSAFYPPPPAPMLNPSLPNGPTSYTPTRPSLFRGDAPPYVPSQLTGRTPTPSSLLRHDAPAYVPSRFSAGDSTPSSWNQRNASLYPLDRFVTDYTNSAPRIALQGAFPLDPRVTIPGGNHEASAGYRPNVVGVQDGIEVIDMTGEGSGNQTVIANASAGLNAAASTHAEHSTLSSPMRRLRSSDLLGPIDDGFGEEQAH